MSRKSTFGSLFQIFLAVLLATTCSTAAHALVGSLADSNGQMVAWGDNSAWQATVPGNNDFVQIAANGLHSLALRSNGALVGFGDISNVPSGTFTTVSTGTQHGLAIRSDETLAAWGSNSFGQCNVPSGTFTAVGGGEHHSVGLKVDGTLAAWGRSDWGQCNVPSGAFAALSVGGQYALALNGSGNVVAWGRNDSSQCDVPSGIFTAISAGYNFGLGIRSDRTLVAWGNNGVDQSNVPGGTFGAVSGGFNWGAAIRSDGTLAAWGANNSNQCSNKPLDGPYVAVAAGDYHGLALRARTAYDGDLKVSGTGVQANLNRSITVAGNATIESLMYLYNNPTMTVTGSITIASGGGTSGDGAINCTAMNILSGGSIGNNLQITGNITSAVPLQIGNGSTSGSLNGNLVNNGGVTFSRSDFNTYSGNISGAGALTKDSVGVLVLTGTNSYSGDTTISAGTLRLGAANALPTGSAVMVADGAKLDLNGFSATVSGVNTSGPDNTGQVDLGIATLTVNRSGLSSNLAANVIGSGSVRKTGSGIVYAWGNNTYGGATLIEGGSLYCTAGTALPATTDVTISSGARLVLMNQSFSVKSLGGGGETILNSGSLTIGGGSFSGPISGSYGLTVNSTGTFTYTGNNTGSGYTGDVNVAKGGLSVASGGRLANHHSYVGSQAGLSATATVSGSGSAWSNSGSLYVGGNASAAQGTGTLTVANSAAVTVTDTLKVWSSGAVNFTGGTISAGSLNVVEVGDFTWTAGTLNLTNSGLTLDPSVSPFGNSLTVGTGKTLTMSLALSVGPSGYATLSVPGGIVSAPGTTIGDNSYANLSITSGGHVATSGSATVGKNSPSNSSANVSGAGSQWTVGGSLDVGGSTSGAATSTSNAYHYAYGSLDVSAGSAVSVGNNLTIGAGWYTDENTYRYGSGTLNVRDQGTTLTVQNTLQVGSGYGWGTLTVDAGAVANVGSLYVYGYSNTVNLNGGTLRANSITVYGSFAFNSGTIDYKNGITVSANDSLKSILGGSHRVRFGQTLVVEGAATLNDPFTLDGGTLTTASLVNPGWLQFTSGTLNLTGASLAVGTTGLFGADLAVPSTKTINVTNAATVDAGARLLVQNGAFSAGTLTNNGEVRMEGGASKLTAGSFANNALVNGNGEIYAPLANAATGRVSVATAERQTWHGAANTNDGDLELIGGTLTFTGSLTNSETGVIIGNGSLIVEGGLFNAGNIAFSATSNIRGPVEVDRFGIVTSSGGTTTFYDDVVCNGEIHTSLGSFTVFFGNLSGRAAFTGPGTVLLEGDIHPGNSPAKVSFAGNLQFGEAAVLNAELGGTTAGTQYDQLSVYQAAEVAGQLRVSLIDGFTPTATQTFDIVTARKGLDGEFQNVVNGHVLLDDGLSAFAVNVDPVNRRVRLSNFKLNEWRGASGAPWSDAANWTAMEPNSAGMIARFGSAAPAAGAVTLDGLRTVRQVQLDNANPYTIAGIETLSLDNDASPAEIDVAQGRHTIAVPVALSSDLLVQVAGSTDSLTVTQAIDGPGKRLEKTGLGTLVLSGNNDFTGGTAVSEGTLVIASAGALPMGRSLSIGSGGTLTLGGGLAMGQAMPASAEPVPEPGTWALLAVGAAAMVLAVWRRRKMR